jgi:hypothetical protein
MFHYLKIPYFTCTFFTKFNYIEYMGPYFLSHVVLRFFACDLPEKKSEDRLLNENELLSSREMKHDHPSSFLSYLWSLSTWQTTSFLVFVRIHNNWIFSFIAHVYSPTLSTLLFPKSNLVEWKESTPHPFRLTSHELPKSTLYLDS